MQIVDSAGHRLYLTQVEREAFEAAAAREDGPVRTLCLLLLYSGARISEGLEVTAGRIDLDGASATLESLKKRRRGIHRQVPLPRHVVQAIDLVFNVRRLQRTQVGRTTRLWSWSRSTAWRHVSKVMKNAGISGPQASPKGLRHGFGVRAVTTGVPLSSLQRWLGHAQLSTTSIYAQAVGAEERELASRMW